VAKFGRLLALDVLPLNDESYVIASERVDFSCRVEVLVTKFGRSSKPSPRMLIIVDPVFTTSDVLDK
jgi:hypothetical protein